MDDLQQSSFCQSLFDSVAQVSSLPAAGSEAVDETAAGSDTPVGVETLHALDLLRLEVRRAVQQVGKGLAVVVVVVVEEQLGVVSQSLCFCNYLISSVESMPI